ncbi:MAG: 3-isopropylmalate dehydratase small subunit [Acetobacteraceae bacterium]
MEPLSQLTAIAAPLVDSDISTDQIVPARFLSRPREAGFARCLFHDCRFTANGCERAEFVLNRAAYKGAKIIVAGANFGCGSSREQAVYALYDYGIRAVIAPCLGDIFRGNCFQNGIAPIALPEAAIAALLQSLLEQPGTEVGVDIAARVVRTPDGGVHDFAIHPFHRRLMLAGHEEIDVSLKEIAKIAAFERRHRIW